MQEHPKISEDLGKIKNEDSRGLKKTLQREEFYSQVPRHLIWKGTPKRTENLRNRARNSLTCA